MIQFKWETAQTWLHGCLLQKYENPDNMRSHDDAAGLWHGHLCWHLDCLIMLQPVCNRKSLSQLPHHHLSQLTTKGLTYDRVENCVSHSPAQWQLQRQEAHSVLASSKGCWLYSSPLWPWSDNTLYRNKFHRVSPDPQYSLIGPLGWIYDPRF